MNTKNLLEDTFRQTRKLVQATQQAGEDAFTYGRKKVEEGIANTKELLHKKKEAERILDEARERYQRAVVQFETEREASLEESSRLDALEQSIINHEFIRFGHLYECAVNRTLQLQTESGHTSLAFEVPALQVESTIHPSIKGIAAGGAAAAATVGMATLFGTASTGAAIAGLHGAAAVGATLSALGGGALSAGGFGIVGGLAVASGAFVIPAIAIGTYFWGTDIQKNYDNALRYREEVDAAVSILDEERGKFKDARRFATTLHHDLSLECIALGTMLDIFEQSLSKGHTKTAYELCGKLVFLMGQSMTLSYPMDSPTGKRASETEQEIHMAAFGRLQQKFGAYIASMEEIHRKEAESFLAAQEESLRQEQPKMNPRMISFYKKHYFDF